VRESGQRIGCEMLEMCELPANSRLRLRMFESIAQGSPGEW